MADVPTPGIHVLRRDNTYSAAHHFRAILANDNRPAPCTTKPNEPRSTNSRTPSQTSCSATKTAERHGARCGDNAPRPSREWRVAYDRAGSEASRDFARDADGLEF